MSDHVFEPVDAQFNFSQAEKETIRYWKENGIYHKSLEQRKDAPRFIFYEGPPTANGLPSHRDPAKSSRTSGCRR